MRTISSGDGFDSSSGAGYSTRESRAGMLAAHRNDASATTLDAASLLARTSYLAALLPVSVSLVVDRSCLTAGRDCLIVLSPKTRILVVAESCYLF